MQCHLKMRDGGGQCAQQGRGRQRQRLGALRHGGGACTAGAHRGRAPGGRRPKGCWPPHNTNRNGLRKHGKVGSCWSVVDGQNHAEQGPDEYFV